MGSGLSTEEKREIVPTPRVNRYHEPQESHPALVHGAQQTGTIPEHGQLRGTNTQRTRPATPRPKHVKVKTLPALPCSITNRLLTGKRPMPDISFCGVKYKSSYELNHLSSRDRYDIPVTGEPGDKLLRLVRRVIEAVMRFHKGHHFIHAYVDSLSPYTVLVETSKKLDWKKFIKPCLDDALGAFEALRIFGLTEGRFEKFVNGLGNRKDRNLLAKLLNPVDRRIEFRCDLRGHASVVVIAEKPDDALINNLIAWIFELRKIGAFDAIFAILDKLDLSMVGEFHDLSEYKPRSWQGQLVDCYRGLTGASLRELDQRRWINFNDLIADLKTELIIGLCDAESGYCDPVMAAKVMLRQARDNPHSGELATGDIVIEALIAIGIPLKDLEKVLGRRNGRSEELWWDKLERRLKDPDRDVDRARLPQLGVSEDSLPRFSLHSVQNAERRIRLHRVKPKSPIKGVVEYILQELVKAVSPGSITKVRSYEHEEKFLISFANSNADETLWATAGAESMFWSFANFGISEEKVAEFFAGHREIETADLFSHGISRLLATPHKSHFAIVAFPDRFELVDKDVKDDEQRLDRAQHLSETIADLEWFDLPTAAETLVPLLRSDLQSLWPGKSLDWAKLALPDLRRVLQILIELRSPPPSAQEHEELAPQESEEPPPQQRHVWRRAV